MADNEKAGSRKAGMMVDSALVRELAEMLAQTGLTEIEVEDGDRRIRVSRALAASPASAAPVMMASVAAAGTAPAAPAAGTHGAAAPAAPAGATPGRAVKSPMVGTAYLSAEPGAAPIVKVGDKVAAGDTLLIVEAMKVMNPITAPAAGTVAEILIGNAEPVEFDQPLMILA